MFFGGVRGVGVEARYDGAEDGVLKRWSFGVISEDRERHVVLRGLGTIRILGTLVYTRCAVKRGGTT